jgi:hypothetical protein
VSTGGAENLQKLSLNFLEAVIAPRGFCGEPKGAFHVDPQPTALIAQLA